MIGAAGRGATRTSGPRRRGGARPATVTGRALSPDQLAELDAELARLARSSSATRLIVGSALERLATKGMHHELGFPTVATYVLERCERSARWTEELRWLARRLDALPQLRSGLLAGRVTWSAAVLAARAASPDDDAEWAGLAASLTVRELRRVAAEMRHLGAAGARAPLSVTAAAGCASPDSIPRFEVEERRVELRISLDLADGWLLEATRVLAEARSAVGDPGLLGADADALIEALLAEGFGAVAPSMPRDAVPAEGFGGPAVPRDGKIRRAFHAERQIWRDAAESLCDERVRRLARLGASGAPREPQGAQSAGIGPDPEPAGARQAVNLDAELRRHVATLTALELQLGDTAERFFLADGWRKLGYATAAQYCTERLGLSLATVKARRALSRSARRLPPLGAALSAGTVGQSAATLVARIADAGTATDWLRRAAERTVLCLRDEVDAATLLWTHTGRLPSPPSDAVMTEVEAFQARVLSGEAFLAAGGPQGPSQTSAQGPSQTSAQGPSQTSAQGPGRTSAHEAPSPPRRRGRVALRLRVREGTRRFFRQLEGLAGARVGRGSAFVRFLCRAFLEVWMPVRRGGGRFAAVHVRDRGRCRSPVCGRQDVTPHHVRFRSQGGDDADENILSLCPWCHLEGVHGGRLTVTGRASAPEFALGRVPVTRVRGRRRIALERREQYSPGP